MKLHEIEVWARRILSRIADGGPLEDSLVELKSKWPSPRWHARQLAGHANAARGNPIMWLIGVDEKSGVCGASENEAGDWYNQIKSEFDGGVAPAMTGPVSFDYAGHTVVAVVFSTTRPPYVIKNPARDTEKSGPFSLEVPWRDGTNTRSAGRAELLVVLSEEVVIPNIDVRRALIAAKTIHRQHPLGTYSSTTPRELLVTKWRIEADLYLAYAGTGTLFVPFHHCTAVVDGLDTCEKPLTFEGATFEAPSKHVSGHVVARSLTIEVAASELIINGAGAVRVSWAGFEEHVYDAPLLGTAALRAELHAVGHVLPMTFSADISAVPGAARDGVWKLVFLISRDRPNLSSIAGHRSFPQCIPSAAPSQVSGLFDSESASGVPAPRASLCGTCAG